MAFSHISDALGDEEDAVESDGYETVTVWSECDDSEEGSEV